jgi:hypothetical protein
MAGINADQLFNYLTEDINIEIEITKKYHCDECTCVYSQQSALSAHKSNVHSEKKYSCDKCPATYVTKSGLIGHTRVKHDNKKYKCDSCLKEFATSSGRRRHKRAYHEHVRYNCSKCNKEYIYSDNMLKHERECDGVRRERGDDINLTERWRCPICNTEVALSYKNRHTKTQHDGTIVIDC